MKSLQLFVALCAAITVAATVSFAQPDTLWTRTYGGSADEGASSVQQTSDGGFIVAGYTGSFGAGGLDFYLVKTNSQGDSLWTQTYGGNGDDVAYSVQQTADGGYILAGYDTTFNAGRQVYLVKTNSQGETLWSRTYGGNDYDWALSVQQTDDGGYILAGITYSFGAVWDDFYLVKTNSQGDTLWTRTYGGSGTDRAFSVDQTTDGGYVVTGLTSSFGGGSIDVYLMKVNGLGDTLWIRTYGGNQSDWAWSVQQTTDGGFILAGGSESYGAGGFDSYLLKTNSLGDTLWTRTFGGDGDEEAYCVQQTTDNGFVIAGWTSSFGAGSDDFYLLKTGPELSADDPFILPPSSFSLASYPNPFNPSTTIAFDIPKSGHISLRLFDVLGREVAVLKDGLMEAGTHHVVFDGSKLASGIYFARLDAAEFSQTKKLMLLK